MLLKILKWIGLSVFTLILLAIITLYAFDLGYILKAIRVTYLTGHTTAYLEDYKYFDNRTIAIGIPDPWPESQAYNSIPSTAKLDSIHRAFGTIAYLIIKQDSIWFEQYYDIGSKSSLSNSFSMAKSILGACLGKAVELNFIKLEDKVIDYLPELKGPYAKDLTVKDLVTMRSGLKWDESYYSPLSITTKAYFYGNLSEAMLELPIQQKPGNFIYQSGDTQLLAMVLSKALPISISDFMSQYFWQPMGAEQEALWQYNPEDNVEKAYCCIASNAKDFARFGKLYKNNGNWNGNQLLDSAYIQASITPVTPDIPQYGYSWWLGDYKGKKTFTMNGHLGQFVICIPDDDIIVVRLGHQNDDKGMRNKNSAFYQYIDQAYEMLQLHSK